MCVCVCVCVRVCMLYSDSFKVFVVFNICYYLLCSIFIENTSENTNIGYYIIPYMVCFIQTTNSACVQELIHHPYINGQPALQDLAQKRARGLQKYSADLNSLLTFSQSKLLKVIVTFSVFICCY